MIVFDIELLLSNMNIGLHQGMKALAVQRGELYRKHTYAAASPRNKVFHGHPHLKNNEGAGGGERCVWPRGALTALEDEQQARPGSERMEPQAQGGEGEGSPLSRPECSTGRRLRACVTTRAVATFAKSPSAPLRATRAPGQPRSGCSSSSRKRCRRSRHGSTGRWYRRGWRRKIEAQRRAF